MGGGTGTGYDIKRETYEEMPFFLIPPVSTMCRLDDYLNIILSDVGEEGGKKTFFSCLTGIKEYRNTEKNANLKKIFTGFFESFWELEKKLADGNLEKLACSIDMQAPDKSGFGLIQYVGNRSFFGDFAAYRLIQRDLLLKIIRSDWGKCLEELR